MNMRSLVPWSRERRNLPVRREEDKSSLFAAAFHQSDFRQLLRRFVTPKAAEDCRSPRRWREGQYGVRQSSGALLRGFPVCPSPTGLSGGTNGDYPERWAAPSQHPFGRAAIRAGHPLSHHHEAFTSNRCPSDATVGGTRPENCPCRSSATGYSPSIGPGLHSADGPPVIAGARRVLETTVSSCLAGVEALLPLEQSIALQPSPFTSEIAILEWLRLPSWASKLRATGSLVHYP
jgi:hypothetical protein